MKYILLALLSMSAFGAVTVKQVKLNEHIVHESYTVPSGSCDIIAKVTIQNENHRSLRIVSVHKGESFETSKRCPVNVNQYSEAVTEFLKSYKGPRFTEFHTGYAHNPLDSEWEIKLALASGKDKDLQRIRIEGEKRVTYQQIFYRTIKDHQVFHSFIEAHKKLGLNLRYYAVEKVFNEYVKNSPYKKELLDQGLKESDRYLSGAGVIYFHVE